MTNLYVPDLSYSCYSVVDKDTIRAYQTIPHNDSYVNYVDYYVNSHYMEKTGTQYFSQYSTLPTCLSSSILTDDIYYLNHFDNIYHQLKLKNLNKQVKQNIEKNIEYQFFPYNEN